MKRILLKLSGEALAGAQKTGFDESVVVQVGKQVKTLIDQGIQVGVVIGGGNFCSFENVPSLLMSLLNISHWISL